MNWLDIVIQNKEAIKLVYGIIVVAISLIIVYISHRLFHLSYYDGLRYFRNAFLFFAIGFFFRYIAVEIFLLGSINPDYSIIIKILFEYFLVMAGFFLLYSLFWKKFEYPKGSYSSLLNARIYIFYIMSLCIVLLDLLWNFYYFMFFSQFLIFLAASIISYNNYSKKGKKSAFLKYYFAAMILTLIAWILNAVAPLFFNWNQALVISVYAINILIFLTFLIGVVKITKKPKLNSI